VENTTVREIIYMVPTLLHFADLIRWTYRV